MGGLTEKGPIAFSHPEEDDIKRVIEKVDIDKDKRIDEEEKKIDVSFMKVISKLREDLYEDSAYIKKKRHLHYAILEVCKNQDGLEPIDVYRWVAKTEAEALELFEKGELYLSYEGAERPEIPEFGYEPAVNADYIPEDFSSKDTKLISRFFYSQCEKIIDAQSGIDRVALKDFFDHISKIAEKSPEIKSELNKLLLDRVQELQHIQLSPSENVVNLSKAERLKPILRVLISSVKALTNRHEDLEDIQFDESAEKLAILSESSQKKEIISEVHGRISSIAIALAPLSISKNPEDFYYPILQLLRLKKDQPGFTLKCFYQSPREKSNFLKYLKYAKFKNPPPKIVFLKNLEAVGEKTFSGWMQDGAVRTRAADGSSLIVEPNKHYEAGAATAYEDLVPYEGNDIQQSELLFQGGNIVVGDKMFIGSDDIYFSALKMRDGKFEFNQNAAILQKDFPSVTAEDIALAVEAFEKEFGKELVVVGLDKGADGAYEPSDKAQGVFHIDMILTPIGPNKLMIAKMEGKEDEYLDKVADQLASQGYEILRTPYFQDDRYDPIMTYNNALLEITDEGKKVYLPQYYMGSKDDPKFSEGVIDIAKLNQKTVELYESQGFEVIPVHISTAVIKKKGSLNCLTFVEREL